jgi:hypothetical protein
MGLLLEGSSIREPLTLTLLSKFKELLVTCLKHPAASKWYLSAEPAFLFKPLS